MATAVLAGGRTVIAGDQIHFWKEWTGVKIKTVGHCWWNYLAHACNSEAAAS